MQIDEAKKEVTSVYKSLAPLVDEVTHKHSKEIDSIISKVKKNLTTLDNK